jgi:predicted alpha-1,6-mannanase (GH76 family)
MKNPLLNAIRCAFIGGCILSPHYFAHARKFPRKVTDRGKLQWMLGEGWTSNPSASSGLELHTNGAKVCDAWCTAGFGKAWTIFIKVTVNKPSIGPSKTDRNTPGSVCLVFGSSGNSPIILFRIVRMASGVSSVEMDLPSDKRQDAKRIFYSGWMPEAGDCYYVRIIRPRCASFFLVEVYGEGSFSYFTRTPSFSPHILSGIKRIGLQANAIATTISDIHISPFPYGAKSYVLMAYQGIRDLVNHYWEGGPGTGHIVPTWNGWRSPHFFTQGGMWERAMMIFALDTYYRSTRDQIAKYRIQSEWSWIKRHYNPRELTTAGNSVQPACDDSGWDALLYLTFYHYTRDPFALKCARELVQSAFDRWMDTSYGGGMWYNDQKRIKSLYQTGIILAAMKISRLTHDPSLYRSALSCYEWVENHLLRSDGLYWCDYGEDGPIGKRRPDDIHQAESVTFLGGDMAMGVIQSLLYRITDENRYRQEALRTVRAIAVHLTKRNILLDDRDAWTNASFAGEWVSNVLFLNGIRRSDRDMIMRTAKSIFLHDRTPEGYYGGCWDGPPDGFNSAWSRNGSLPQQLMTSADSVNILAAAALLESRTAEGGNRRSKARNAL